MSFDSISVDKAVYDIAVRLLPEGGEAAFLGCLDFVNGLGRADADFMGLVGAMAEQILHRRMDRIIGGVYMGRDSLNWDDCFSDAATLMGRVLLNNSYDGNPLTCIKRDLQTRAYYIYLERIGGGFYGQGDGNLEDWFHAGNLRDGEQARDRCRDWLTAQRDYAREGLHHFEKLLELRRQVTLAA
jgi:hypothetical protein